MKRTLTATVVLAAGFAALSLGCQKKEPAAATETQAAPSETPSAYATPGPMTATETAAPPAGVTPTAVP